MIYLSGCVRPDLPDGVGVMLTMMTRYRLPEGRVRAADTGCYATPHKYSDGRYLAWLAGHAPAADRCLFATAPDVVGDGPATLALARPMLPRIRALGLPAALVVQPGITAADVPWDALDAIFVGGPDDWHTSDDVLAILRAARQRGLWCHEGRVNSEGRLRAARVAGFDSADGTYLAFGPDVNLPKLAGWVHRVQLQPRLFALAEVS